MRVRVPARPHGAEAFEEWLGASLEGGHSDIEVTFSREDARRPFLTANPAMWSIVEPELRKRLADLEGNATFRERTAAVLLEALPSGQTGIDAVSRRLGAGLRGAQLVLPRLREVDGASAGGLDER